MRRKSPRRVALGNIDRAVLIGLYRLAPKGNNSSVPALNIASAKGLTAALASPNSAVRALAMAKLREQGLPKASDRLSMKKSSTIRMVSYSPVR